MNKIGGKSKMTLEKFAKMTQDEFLVVHKKIRGIQKNMATKDDLKHFATHKDLKELKHELKRDIQTGTVEVLRAVNKITEKFDKAEKEEAAHSALHHRITDQFHNHEVRIKKLEARV